jgi:hypothetical protein
VVFGNSSVEQFATFATAEVAKLQGSDLSSYVVGDSFLGFCCGGCNACFPKKYHAVRHCNGKNSLCLESAVTYEGICKTVCGRLIPASKVASPVPAGSEIPFSVTEEFLDKYVSGDEKVSQYITIYHPMTCLGGDCCANMSAFVDMWHQEADNTEGQLSDLLERAEYWLNKRSRNEVGMVPANYRAAIQVFDGQEVGDVSINHTFNFRHFERNLSPELKYLLSFAWRRSKTSRGHVLQHFQRTYDLHRRNPFFVARLLQALFVERIGGGFEAPLVVEYCLARSFRKRDDTLTMIKCDLVASQVAATMSILRSGLCSYILSFPLTMDEVGPVVCKQVRTSRVSNILCPFIRHLKEMHQRKGTVRMKTISPEGDIAVQGFEFPKSVWSKLIGEVFKICKHLLSQLLVGDNWALVLDANVPISIEISNFKKVIFRLRKTDGQVFNSSEVMIRPDFESVDYDRLASYLGLAFFGFGGGATRGTEVANIALSHAKWHRNTIYYDTYSEKSYSFRSQSSAVAVEHKLPAVIARCFLLFRVLVNSRDDLDLKKLIPERVESQQSLTDAITELFNFENVPSTTQARQFFTGVSNFLFPDSNWDGLLCANREVSEMSAHSATTHRASYSTTILNGRESVYRIFHQELGGDFGTGLAATSIVYTKTQLLQALRRVVGPLAQFTCPQQEHMVWIAANSCTRHAHVGLPCGTGKSMGWTLPAVARIQAGYSFQMQVVILPYKFLMLYHLETTRSKLQSIFDIDIEGYTGQDIQVSSLPLVLQEARLLPEILFLTLEAAVNLVSHHGSKMNEWVGKGLVKRIFIDEVHTMLGEGFREAYATLPSLVKFEVPVMTMSGTVPGPLVPYLLRHLGMSTEEKLRDVDVVECDDCLGYFPPDFEFTVEQDTQWITKAVAAVVSILGSNPTHGVHVLTTTKKLGESFFNQMSRRFTCRWITAETSSAEQAVVARDWSLGKFQILISTTIALVGNENSLCHHIIMLGYMFSLMAVIQAIGRLRPVQRLQGSSFRIFIPVLNAATLAQMDEKRILGYDALRKRKLIGDDGLDLYTRVCSMRGIYDWLVLSPGCRIKNLAARYGYHRPECRFCDVCRGNPTRLLATRAKIVVAEKNTIINSAVRVLKQLANKCLHCMDEACGGEKCMKGLCCYRCGQPHNSRSCKDKDVASQVLYQRACFHCFDFFGRRDYRNHECNDCPLQRRLRRIVFAKYNPNDGSFSQFLNQIYADQNSFYAFVASFELMKKR